MQRGIIAWMTLAIVAIVTVMASVEATPYQRPIYWDQREEEDPKVIMNRLPRTTGGRHPERGGDLGLHRGSSGSKVAQHRIGLQLANNPIGPGRRRRSEQA